MFAIIGKRDNKYGVRDSDDGVVEYYTISELRKIVSQTGVTIKGFENGKVVVGKKSASKPKKEVNVQAVFDNFFRLMKQECSFYGACQEDLEAGYACIRDWGDWSVPDDVDEDEAMDYDWEILDVKWCKILKSIENKLKQMYPEARIYISPEEKNYIGLRVSNR